MVPLVAPNYSQQDTDAVREAAWHLDDESIVARLEARLADHFGVAGSVCTTSGTAALHLALMAVDDELRTGEFWVEYPTYTCVALLNATRLAFAQEDLTDCLYDPDAMQFGAKDFYDGADGIELVPHMFGVKTPLRAGLTTTVIEDWAQALGTMPAVISGSCAILSFHWSKMVSGQHGGAIVTNDPDLLARLRDLNDYDGAAVADRLNQKPTYTQRVNYRLSPLNAALVMSQLDQLPSFVARRRQIAEFYNAELQGCPAILPTQVPAGSVFGRYCMALTKHHPVDAIKALAEYGIEAGRGVYPCLHQYLGLPDEQFPNAMTAVNTVLSLPVYPALSDLDVENIAEATRKVLR